MIVNMVDGSGLGVGDMVWQHSFDRRCIIMASWAFGERYRAFLVFFTETLVKGRSALNIWAMGLYDR